MNKIFISIFRIFSLRLKGTDPFKSMATPEHKNLCPRGHEIYNISRPFIGWLIDLIELIWYSSTYRQYFSHVTESTISEMWSVLKFTSLLFIEIQWNFFWRANRPFIDHHNYILYAWKKRSFGQVQCFCSSQNPMPVLNYERCRSVRLCQAIVPFGISCPQWSRPRWGRRPCILVLLGISATISS